MSKTGDIISAVRALVKDRSASKYTEQDLVAVLKTAILVVNGELGTSYVYHAGDGTITPDLTTSTEPIVAMAAAMITIMGEENSAAISGGGGIWKSGLSSISLVGHQKGLQEAVKRIQDVYERFIVRYKIGQLTVADITTYDNLTDTDLFPAN